MYEKAERVKSIAEMYDDGTTPSRRKRVQIIDES